jgi:hypothetical protein
MEDIIKNLEKAMIKASDERKAELISLLMRLNNN